MNEGHQTDAEQIELLTKFCVHNHDLDRLNSLLAEFNLFEAAGLTRDEVKHSKFLSFLLNPKEAHGLGDAFLTRMLQKAIEDSGMSDLPVRRLDLELWDLTDTEVRVEWSNIDILVLNHARKLAIVIENKVGTGEHSEQLQRYYSLLAHHFSGWRVLPLFLSPKGTKPTDERYVPVTYELIAAMVQHFLTSRQASLSTSVQIVLEHYHQLLRRHVVSDSSVKELCQEIYRKHKKALDLIFEHRPDEHSAIREYISGLIDSDPKLLRNGKNWNAFLPVEWAEWMPKSEQRSWSNEGFLCLFWFEVTEKGVRLILEIGPGPRELAQTILTTANENRPLFDPQSKKVGKSWNRIVRSQMVSPAAMQSGDQERIVSEFEAAWKKFIEQDMEIMAGHLRPAIQGPAAKAA